MTSRMTQSKGGEEGSRPLIRSDRKVRKWESSWLGGGGGGGIEEWGNGIGGQIGRGGGGGAMESSWLGGGEGGGIEE